MSKAAKVGAAAFTAAAGAVVAVGKKSLDAYAEYEQLAGGAELLWGGAYDFIADKASNAYKTVQMSQNDYLTQVNGFSTGLKTALGGNEQAAADLADKIITAEADIVAATGASQESIQNAFNGIMKSNYTMLDNLQLGITPTKEGFQQVIDKVNEWNAANGEATKYQIDNLADCEAALVDYVEMQGLAGYAAGEASQTIQGSVAAMKGAWENLLVAFGDESADVGAAFDNLAESAANAFGNIAPRVVTILGNLGKLVQQKGPEIVQFLIDGITTYGPKVAEVAGSLIVSLIAGLIKNLPKIVVAAGKIMLTLVNAIFNSTGQLLLVGGQALDKFVAGIAAKISNARKKGAEIIASVKNGIMEKLSEAKKWGSDLIANFISGITGKIGAVKDAISTVAGTIRSFIHFSEPDEGPLSDFHTYAPDMMDLFAKGIRSKEKDIRKEVSAFAGAISEILTGVKDTIDTKFGLSKALFEMNDAEYDMNNTGLREAKNNLETLNELLSKQKDRVDEAKEALDAEISAQERLVELAEEIYDRNSSSTNKQALEEQKRILANLKTDWRAESAEMDRMLANAQQLYELNPTSSTKRLLDAAMQEYTAFETRAGAFFNETQSKLQDEQDAYNNIKSAIEEVTASIEGMQSTTDLDKAKANLALLTEQADAQAKAVSATETAWSELRKKYGEGATATEQMRTKLADAKTEWYKTKLAIEEVNDEIRRYNALIGSGTSSVSFSKSAVGTSSAAMINTMSNNKTETVNMTATMVTPEGKTLANWILNPLINAAKSNGTPIVNPA